MAYFALTASDGITSNSSAIASSNAEVVFSGGYTIPANTLLAGNQIKAEWGGIFSTTGTPTANFRIRYGPASTGVLVLDFGTVATNNNAANRSWKVMFTGTVRTAGATGTLAGSGVLILNNGASELVTGSVVTLSTNSTVTIDTTAATVFNCSLQWSASSSSNTATRINQSFMKGT